MADDDANGDIGGDSDDVQQEKSQKKIAKYDSGAADLEKVTDYAEEKEVYTADLSGVSFTWSLTAQSSCVLTGILGLNLLSCSIFIMVL